MKQKPIPGLGRASSLIPPNQEHAFFAHQGHPFEPQVGEFTMRTAWWLAEMSLLVYSDDAFVRDNLEAAGFEWHNAYHAKVTDTDCYVAAKGEHIVVAFRGTEFISFREWIFNLKFNQVPWPNGGRVHNGFQIGLERVWENEGLGADLERLRNEGKIQTLWFTGHSLGGAIATLAAERFYHASNPKVQIGLITFGCPRVGNKAFRDAFHADPVHRFVNNRDIVPRVPFGILGYRHVGTLHYIDRKGRIHTHPTWWFRHLDHLLSAYAGKQEDENRQYWLTFFIYVCFEYVIDHAPLHYTNRIWNGNLHNPNF